MGEPNQITKCVGCSTWDVTKWEGRRGSIQSFDLCLQPRKERRLTVALTDGLSALKAVLVCNHRYYTSQETHVQYPPTQSPSPISQETQDTGSTDLSSSATLFRPIEETRIQDGRNVRRTGKEMRFRNQPPIRTLDSRIRSFVRDGKKFRKTFVKCHAPLNFARESSVD